MTEPGINGKKSAARSAAPRITDSSSVPRKREEEGMKVLVTYYTQTGNTEQLAKAIYEAVTVQKEIQPLAQAKAAGYDLVFCGFPVQAHSVPGKMAEFVKGLPKGQKVVFFATHGSLRGGQLPKQAFESAAGLAANLKVLGQFGCRGKVDPKVIDALMKKPEHKAWAEEALGANGNPDAADLKEAAEFAQAMVGKAY